MITGLLLPLLLAGATAGGAVRADRAMGGDDPAIQLWINNGRTFLPGDRAKVQVRSREDGYLLVLHVDPDGVLRVLFPLDPNDDSFVRGGKKYEIRGRGGRESFAVDGRSGRGTVYAAVSPSPFHFDQFVLGDHWDYRGLAPQRLPSDPEQDLNELVRRMADASFDYDILAYNVVERVYADNYSTPYYGYYDGYLGGCGYSYFGCGRAYYGSPYSLSVGLFFGRPYRRYYYDPFYDPFFFDPYYYRPVYIYPVRNYGYYYGYPYFGYPSRGYPYYGYPHYGRPRGWDRPYTPYRFRPADGVQAGYRDRGFDLRRSVNTVYLPPVVRDRSGPGASPVRRVTDPRPSAEARPTEARPAPDRRPSSAAADKGAARQAGGVERAPDRGTPRRAESRTVRPNIEARRAREPDVPRTLVPDSRERQNLPTEVRPAGRSDQAPRRAAVDRPQEVRGPDPRPAPAVEARPSRDDRGSRGSDPRPESRPQPQARPDPGPARGGYSPPASSDGGSRRGWSGGGDRGGGSDGGRGGMTGGRRR